MLWYRKLPINTIFKIKKILKYDKFYNKNLVTIIDILNNNYIYANAPIKIDSRLAIKSKDKKYIIMDPQYFEEIK